VRFFDMPRIEVSSTLVRHRAAQGQPIRYLVPDKVANLIGALVFLLPAIAVAWHYLPGRIAQARRLTTAARVLDRGLDAERERLLAMRAAFALPYAQLLRYTRDPIGDLTAGRYEPLIDAAVEDAGLRRRS
jgi:hypothetical protein